MEYVPDDVYDMEYDKRYNPMAKKAKGSRKKGSGVALNEKIKGNKESLFHLTSETFIKAPTGKKTSKLTVEWTPVPHDKLAQTRTHEQKMGKNLRRKPHKKRRLENDAATNTSQYNYKREVRRLKGVELFNRASNRVDRHNHHRQSMLALEEVWRVNNLAWYHRPWATIIGIIETDSFFSFKHFENPEGEKERTHEFHTRELARQLIFNELDGPRDATPAGTRSKASGMSKSPSSPRTPRNTSKGPNTSSTPECEKHIMLPIADLPGAPVGYKNAPCSVCKARQPGRAPKVSKYCVACSDIPNGKLVCVCSRKRGTGEADDSCYSYHTRHPLDFIPTRPDFLKGSKD